MELTKLTHKLTIGGVAHIIDEPIGFDGLKTKISRGNYHGISAEVSTGKLEFYDNAGRNAASIIRDAYNTDIDTEITYTVADDSGELLYSGVIDLSTYSETNGNATKVSVNVGEVGIKTTFNNRTETEIDLNRADTIDGTALAHLPSWRKLKIPAKTIAYTNMWKAKDDVVWTSENAQQGEYFRLADDLSHQWIEIPVSGLATLEEFGETQSMPYIVYANPDIAPSDPRIGSKVVGDFDIQFFKKDSGWDDKYGAGSKYQIVVDVVVTVEPADGGDYFTNSPTGGIQEFTADFVLIDGTATMNGIIQNNEYLAHAGQQTFTNNSKVHTFHLQATLNNCNYQRLCLGVAMRNRNFYEDNISIHHYYNNPRPMKITVAAGSHVTMTLESVNKDKDIKAEMLFVHEALNKIVECISDNQLHVVSDYYGRHDSIYAPLSVGFGKGALKAITNGYKIRGLFTDDENERNMPLSFKNIIEALDAIDCIGWGFFNENGNIIVRVEDFAWFYKNDVILTINEPNEKTRTATTDNLITQLTIGYKKYTTNEDINSIDSVHSERVFNTGVKAVSKEVSKLCAFIADNYAIESTRRKAILADTEEFKYDENIFVFELASKSVIGGGTTPIGGGGEIPVLRVPAINLPVQPYFVPTNRASSVVGITFGRELYNAALSPRRMAERWKQRMAFANSSKAFELTKGTVNYKAAFALAQSSPNSTQYLDTVSGQLAEDAPIANGLPLMKSETLKVKYPLTHNQYKTVKANPYGLIVVDGEKCWLKEMQYEFKTGLTELTLIPKYEQ